MLDLAIIGGGAAGYTAALYGARGGLNTAVFEGLLPGGQTATIMKLENFPGFPAGIEGAELMARFQQQAEAFGAITRYDKLEGLSQDQGLFHLKGEGWSESSRSVIIATGAKPRMLGLSREEKLTGRGVSYCATCDGPLYRNKCVAVVGGGNTALTDALVLSNYAERVYLIHRRDSFRGSPLLQKRAEEAGNIQILRSHQVAELLGELRLTGLVLEKPDHSREELPINGLFVAVGVDPATQAFRDLLELDTQGRIRTGPGLTTSVPGIFAAGDCRDTPLRQVVSAAADGALAAESALAFCHDLV